MLFLRLEQEYFHKKRVEVLCTARCSCSFFDCTSIHGCFEWPPPVLGGALMPRPLFWSRRWAGLSIQKSPMASINLRQISKEAVSQNEAFCTSFSSCFYSFFFLLVLNVSVWVIFVFVEHHGVSDGFMFALFSFHRVYLKSCHPASQCLQMLLDCFQWDYDSSVVCSW